MGIYAHIKPKIRSPHWLKKRRIFSVFIFQLNCHFLHSLQLLSLDIEKIWNSNYATLIQKGWYVFDSPCLIHLLIINPIRELFAEGCKTELRAVTRTDEEVSSYPFLKDLNGLIICSTDNQWTLLLTSCPDSKEMTWAGVESEI